MGRLGSFGSEEEEELWSSASGARDGKPLLTFLSFFPPLEGASSTSSEPPRLAFLSFLPARMGVVEKGRTASWVWGRVVARGVRRHWELEAVTRGAALW